MEDQSKGESTMEDRRVDDGNRNNGKSWMALCLPEPRKEEG